MSSQQRVRKYNLWQGHVSCNKISMWHRAVYIVSMLQWLSKYCFVGPLIQELTFLFSAENSNVSDALFSGVSRC